MHPRQFGKYTIVKLLPLGGMGRVYLALDNETNTQVALKLIELGPEPEIAEIVEAERRGAILQARLCGVDSRITLIRRYGDLDGFFFIEMEYVEGQDLSELLRKGPLGVPFAARIGCDICEVLKHAHNFSAEIEGHQYHGIVHGDIKPRNIRITPDGQVKVLDFGIAKALSLTRKFTTNRFGSSQYSSPERLNTGEVDIASDLWSVGVVLYEVVAARPYFVADNAARLEHQIRNYGAVSELPSSLPDSFAAILRKALHPQLHRRYETAQAFAADLKAFLENRPVAATAAAGEDMEATRRAYVPVNAARADEETRRRVTTPDDAATRRTGPPPPSAAPAAPDASALSSGAFVKRAAAAGRQKHSYLPRERRIRFFAGLVLFIVLGMLFFNEFSAWKRSAALKHEVETERLTDMAVAWTRYENIRKASVLPIVHSGARGAIQDRLVSAASRVIDEYRESDSPRVSEADWARAQTALARALDIDPGNDDIRGKLYIVEGHLHRIRGTARGLNNLLSEARARFDEARRLVPKSPDPYLGLARLYVYNFRDVEKAEEALEQARRKGYDWGRRERSQLADGFRDRGDKYTREAARAAGSSEEKEFLDRAKSDYRQAENYYREVMPFGSSVAQLRRVVEQIASIEQRLSEIEHGEPREGV